MRRTGRVLQLRLKQRPRVSDPSGLLQKLTQDGRSQVQQGKRTHGTAQTQHHRVQALPHTAQAGAAATVSVAGQAAGKSQVGDLFQVLRSVATVLSEDPVVHVQPQARVPAAAVPVRAAQEQRVEHQQ